jgi:hypothetical protein
LRRKGARNSANSGNGSLGACGNLLSFVMPLFY